MGCLGTTLILTIPYCKCFISILFVLSILPNISFFIREELQYIYFVFLDFLNYSFIYSRSSKMAKNDFSKSGFETIHKKLFMYLKSYKMFRCDFNFTRVYITWYLNIKEYFLIESSSIKKWNWTLGSGRRRCWINWKII